MTDNDIFALDPQDPEDPVPSGTPRKKRLWLRIIVGTFVALFVAGGATAGIFIYNLNSSFDQAVKLAPGEVFPEETHRPEPVKRPETAKHDAQNILLLGSDSRGGIEDDLDDIKGTRSDVIMVAHIPANRESVQVISFMRDNWVDIPGYGKNKINAALAYGGVPLIVQTIEGIIDARIDHVAVIDFEGFQGLTDALGGVTLNNPFSFHSSSGPSFAEGDITLNGEDALAYVRERYSFADGDYSRAANQQRYLKAVISSFLSKDTLLNPAKLAGAVDAVAPYLTVDEGLTPTYLASLGASMPQIRAEDITFFTSPTLGTGMVGEASVVHPDWDQLAVIAEHFRNDTLSEYAANK